MRSPSKSPLASLLGALALVAMVSFACRASAQEEPSAQQREAAARAYDRGVAAYLAEQWPQAAEWFETAFRMAPSPAALTQAVRARDRAGHGLRAATLATRLIAEYPQEASGQRIATPIIASAESAFGRVDVVCEGCSVDLDGTLMDWTTFFLEGGAEHRLVLHFPTGDVEQVVQVAAGQRQEVRAEAPAAQPEPAQGWGYARIRPEGERGPVREGGATEETATPSDSTPVIVVGVVGGVLTAGAGIGLIVSGLDAQSGVAAYEAMPTTEALATGQSKETTTNVLIGVTAGLAALTVGGVVITALATGGSRPAVTGGAAPVAGGAMGFVGGTF